MTFNSKNKPENTASIEKVVNDTDKKLSFFEVLRENKKNLFWIILASFFYAFASTSLLTKASSIPSGLSSISMTISLILPVVKPYLNFIYLALNAPLIIIFWKKIKQKYIYLTFIFLLFNAIFGFFIGFDFIGDGIGSLDYLITQNVLVFCPPMNEREQAYADFYHMNNLATVRVNDFNKWLVDNGWYTEDQIKQIDNALTLGVQKGWPIFVYVLTGVSFGGVSAGVAWKCGGSTGGTDIIAYYYSTKKKKEAGSVLIVIGFIITTFMLLILWTLSAFGPSSIASNINGFTSIIGLQTLASCVYIVLYGRLVNIVYPKYVKVALRIDTVNVDLLKEYFTKSNFNHPYKINPQISGKTGNNIYTFETIVLLLESDDLIADIKKVDPSAWISRMAVQKTYGAFDYSKVE